MLVNERMSHPVITVQPDLPIMEALDLMRSKNVRRFPVVDRERLVGIVSDKDLLNAAPSDATTLTVWEMNYLLGKVKVKDVMTKEVITVTETTPIEEAAFIMANNKIGGLPVMRDGRLVGLITETDLFKIFLELMGAREIGVRITALVPDVRGELDALTHAISEVGGEFIAFGQFAGHAPSNRMITFKVRGMTEAQVEEAIAPHIEKLIDIRTCCS